LSANQSQAQPSNTEQDKSKLAPAVAQPPQPAKVEPTPAPEKKA
jgi:hypothetical protein